MDMKAWGGGAQQGVEGQVVVLQHPAHVAAVHVGQEDDPNVAVLLPHVLDHGGGLGLVQPQRVGVRVDLSQKLLKGADYEIVVLAADEEGGLLPVGAAEKIFADVVCVPQQTVAELQQLPSLVGDGDAGGGAGKDGDPQLLLQRVDQIADAGLGDVQLLGGAAEGAALLHHGNVFQLL